MKCYLHDTWENTIPTMRAHKTLVATCTVADIWGVIGLVLTRVWRGIFLRCCQSNSQPWLGPSHPPEVVTT